MAQMSALSTFSRWLRGLGPKPEIERRRSPRTPFSERLTVRTANGTTFHGIGRDVSDSGLGALVCADLQAGESVVLYYTQLDGAATKFICRPAQVRRRHGNLYGFEFQNSPSA